MSIVRELRRRNVFRVAIAYVIVAWLILQIGDTLGPALRLPEAVNTALAFFLILGFPLAVFFAWAYELTPEGIKKEKDVDRSQSITHVTGRKLDYIIIAVLLSALGYFAFDKFVLDPSRDAELVQPTTEAVTERAAETADKSIAVLAFADLSPEGDQEYFSDGISEEILNVLSQIPGLQVTSRSSAFSFKGKGLDIPTVAKQLGVANILEGSVRMSGNRIRITAQLVDARNGFHLWSETYDRTMDDIFAIQDDIAVAVVNQLEITLLGDLPMVSQIDPEAYRLLLLANYLSGTASTDSQLQAVEALEKALAISPDFAEGWRKLAVIYLNNVNSGLLSADPTYTLAKAALEKSLQIDPDNAKSYTTLGGITVALERDFVKAAQYYNHALAIDPYSDIVHNNVSIFLKILGRVDDAIAVNRVRLSKFPLNRYAQSAIAECSLYAGRPEQALTAGEAILAMRPDANWILYIVGRAYLLKGQPETALEFFEREPLEHYRLLGQVMAYHMMAQQSASDAALENLIQEYGQSQAFKIAAVLAYRNEADRAFEWLEKAERERIPDLSYAVAESLFTSVHDDPRWLPFLESINMSPAQIDAIEIDIPLRE